MRDEMMELRRQLADLEDEQDRAADPPSPGPAFLLAVVVADGTAGTMVELEVCDCDCADDEGAVPTFTPRGDKFFALCLAADNPMAGTHVRALQVEGIWTFP